MSAGSGQRRTTRLPLANGHTDCPIRVIRNNRSVPSDAEDDDRGGPSSILAVRESGSWRRSGRLAQGEGERAVVPEASVLFDRFLFAARSVGGARVMFQSLITDLVMLRHPGASEVAGPGGGDWGIDTYVGMLDDTVVVWQSKFFTSWNGEDQRKQVRDSFKQLMEKAQSENFVVDAWTLCVPCVLAPGEQQWFDRWAAKARREHGVAVTMWNGVKLRRLLMQADAVDVYKAYFTGEETQVPVQPLRTLQDVSTLNDALFVRQLEEAGHIETDAARGLFFAAEALARDLAAAGNADGIAALEELHLEVQSLWEEQFNTRVSGADSAGRMQDLVAEVLRGAAKCADPAGLRVRSAHRKGIAHRLVEDMRAGWVRHWRDIAAAHRGRPARESLAAELATGGSDDSS